jgi:hypothetical protein
LAVKCASTYSNFRIQNVHFLLVYLTRALNGELIRKKMKGNKRGKKGGNRRKETQIKEKSSIIKNVTNVTICNSY